MEGVLLKYATAQPLARLAGDGGVDYFFFAPPGMEVEYTVDHSTYARMAVKHCAIAEENGITYVTAEPGLDCLIEITKADGSRVRLVTLTRSQAEMCSSQMLWGRQRLIISDAWAVVNGEELQLYSAGQKQVELFIYPAPVEKLESSAGACKGKAEGIYTHYTVKVSKKEIKLNVERPAEDRACVHLTKGIFADGQNAVYRLRIDYAGDTGEAYIDGKLVGDNFYNGMPWEIGLNRFAGQLEHDNELLILIQPLEKTSSALRYIPTGMAFRKEANRDHLAEIKSITAVVEQKVIVRPSK
jgi:hypothetical protein